MPLRQSLQQLFRRLKWWRSSLAFWRRHSEVSQKVKYSFGKINLPSEAFALWSAHHQELAESRFILAQHGRSLSRVPVRGQYGGAHVLSLFCDDSAFLLDDHIWQTMRRGKPITTAVDYIISFDSNAAIYLPRLFEGADEPYTRGLRLLLRHFEGHLNFDILPFLHEYEKATVTGQSDRVSNIVVASHRLATIDARRFMETGELISTISEKELVERANAELEHFRGWLSKGELSKDLRWRRQAMHAQLLKMAILWINHPRRDQSSDNLRWFIEFQHEKLACLQTDTLALAWEWFSKGPRAAICDRLQRGAVDPVKVANNISWDLTHMFHLRQQVVFPTRSKFIIPHFLTFDRGLASLLGLCAIKSCLISPQFLYPQIYPERDPELILREALEPNFQWDRKHVSREAYAQRMATRQARPELDGIINELEEELLHVCNPNNKTRRPQPATSRRRTSPEASRDALFIWEFKRHQVETQEFSEFMSMFAELPERSALRARQGSITFCVEGYDEDERELVEIAEVRHFFQRLAELFPYWFFFVDLQSLETILFCSLPSHRCVQQAGNKVSIRHEFESEEMASLIAKQTPRLAEVCKLAGLNDAEREAILRRITQKYLPAGFSWS